MWPWKHPSHSCQTCPGLLAWGKELKHPLWEGFPDIATKRKAGAPWGTSTLLLLTLLLAPSPGKPLSSGKCPSDVESLCDIPALSGNLGLVGFFHDWLVWEGGDSNFLRVYEREERLAFAAGCSGPVAWLPPCQAAGTHLAGRQDRSLATSGSPASCRKVGWCLALRQVVLFLLSGCFYCSVKQSKTQKLAESVLWGNPLILLALLSV